MDHHETKRLYLAYRAKARELFEERIHFMPCPSDKWIKVSEHANVQMTEDGAFVEATVWIPKEKL